MRLPRTFNPVKTDKDLLALRRDVYELDEAGDRTTTHEGDEPYVDLDPEYFKILADFDARFPVEPSLVRADRLEVRGDVAFGKDAVIVGDVELQAPAGGAPEIPHVCTTGEPSPGDRCGTAVAAGDPHRRAGGDLVREVLRTRRPA